MLSVVSDAIGLGSNIAFHAAMPVKMVRRKIATTYLFQGKGRGSLKLIG